MYRYAIAQRVAREVLDSSTAPKRGSMQTVTRGRQEITTVSASQGGAAAMAALIARSR